MRLGIPPRYYRVVLGIIAFAAPVCFSVRGRSLSAAAAEPAGKATGGPVRILVAYYSRSGNTETMARAVAAGARAVPGTNVVLKRVQQVTKQDLEAADGILLGCPTYFANIPGRMKLVIDDWNWKMKVDFTDKVGGAFATGGGQTGGKEHVVVSLLLFMINNRMIVAGPLYEDESGEDKWAEIGSSAMTGPLDPGVGDDEAKSGWLVGNRIARIAVRLRDSTVAN